MVKDPVCGMEVDEKKAVASLVYGDKTYYFCAQACKRAFEKEVTGRSAMSHPREADLVFLIADLAGYTALTEAMGDMEAATVIARYVELAHDVLRPGTRLVERVGDELLIVGDEVPSTLRTARDLHAAVECEPLFPEVRAGLHAGRVLDYDGKYIGAALNLTARVTSYATPGQILCTEAVATQAEGLGDIKCRDVGADPLQKHRRTRSGLQSHRRPWLRPDDCRRSHLPGARHAGDGAGTTTARRHDLLLLLNRVRPRVRRAPARLRGRRGRPMIRVEILTAPG